MCYFDWLSFAKTYTEVNERVRKFTSINQNVNDNQHSNFIHNQQLFRQFLGQL